MEFTEETLGAMRAYVKDNGRESTVEVSPGEARLSSWDNGKRFRAAVRPSPGGSFMVTVEDSAPEERELGFPYGLPFTVELAGTWEAREVLHYVRSLLSDYMALSMGVREFVRACREMSCRVYELNRGYGQLGVKPVDVASGAATVAARAASPGKRVEVSVREVPGESRG